MAVPGRHPRASFLPAFGRLAPLCLLASLACSASCTADPSGALGFGPSEPDPREELGWWLDRYREVPASQAYAAQSHRIFDRLRPVFDFAGRRLVVIRPRPQDRRDLGPLAVALRDGNVVVSYAALELCYREADRTLGESRLAFVLAHELAHLDHEDHVKLTAAEAVHAFGAEARRTGGGSRRGSTSGEDRKALELTADRQGALGMVMAGFDPRVLFGQDQTFFAAWVDSSVGRAAYASPDHPSPQERARWLREQLAETAERTVHFDRGVAAYDKGDYPMAVEELETFAQDFPSREVLSNLGLAYYQLAVRVLARCDGQLVVRWRMPVALDRETLAKRARLRGERSHCYDDADYRKQIDRAIEALEDAAKQDAKYLPARLNLAAARLLDGQGAGAIMAAEEATRLAPGDPRALGTLAVASLAYAESSPRLADAGALDDLAALHRRFPADPDIAYNLAQALTHGRRWEEAQPVWQAFLKLVERKQDGDEWAKIARENLGD